MRPSTGTANAKELYFDRLDSGYKVGTAGTKGVGRSSTIQLFHGSEVAFWSHTGEHAAGIMQAIPDMADTEIILESTAKGLGNFFHVEWQNAERGLSDYIAIFVPWFWQEEYSRPVPSDFVMTPEEADYRQLYNLTPEHIGVGQMGFFGFAKGSPWPWGRQLPKIASSPDRPINFGPLEQPHERLAVAPCGRGQNEKFHSRMKVHPCTDCLPYLRR